MNYTQMKETLLQAFREVDFSALARAGRWNTHSIPLSCVHSSLPMRICFPGYKSKVQGNEIVYDYRVEVKLSEAGEWTAISHVNILVDLYFKAWCNKHMMSEWNCWLISLAEYGTSVSPARYGALSGLRTGPLPDNFTGKVAALHKSLGKEYNAGGNARPFTTAELSDLIPWIALQEDINYPSSHHQGRKMPFYRYLEAVYCGACAKSGHKISQVIERALSHSMLQPWDDAPEIPYSAVKNINR